MNTVFTIQMLAVFVNYAVLAVFAQNAVFSRALGVSRLIKLVNDSATGTLVFCSLLSAVQLVAAPFSWYAFLSLSTRWPAYRGAIRPIVHLTCAAIAFLIVYLVTRILPVPHKKDIRKVLPGATFNSCVLGTLLICANQSYTLVQYLGFSLGSGFGYLLAVLAVDEAERRLRSRAVPNAFKGMPITLIYIGILSLAIYGFTGHSLAI